MSIISSNIAKMKVKNKTKLENSLKNHQKHKKIKYL